MKIHIDFAPLFAQVRAGIAHTGGVKFPTLADVAPALARAIAAPVVVRPPDPIPPRWTRSLYNPN
jgi:hypothetical protein